MSANVRVQYHLILYVCVQVCWMNPITNFINILKNKGTSAERVSSMEGQGLFIPRDVPVVDGPLPRHGGAPLLDRGDGIRMHFLSINNNLAGNSQNSSSRMRSDR